MTYDVLSLTLSATEATYPRRRVRRHSPLIMSASFVPNMADGALAVGVGERERQRGMYWLMGGDTQQQSATHHRYTLYVCVGVYVW